MKIGIVGAGAIGCFFAARLAKAGHSVSVVARGKTLAALRSRGVRYDGPDGQYTARVTASDQSAQLGAQDMVIIAVKAPALPAIASLVMPMLQTDTCILPALNGLPWWFFLGDLRNRIGKRLASVDQDGVLEAALPYRRVIGSVVFPACSCPEPGYVRHASGERVVFGEPDGGSSARVLRLVDELQQAGFAAEASPDIRRELWLKLLGNACFNPVSLLIGCTTDQLINDARIHALFVGMMQESLSLGRALGIDVAISPVDRIAITRKLGAVKTSMLQDVEAARRVEIDGILGAVVELADALGHPAPLLQAVYALARMRAQFLSLY